MELKTVKMKNKGMAEEFDFQVNACEKFISKYLEKTNQYKIDRSISIFDVRLSIKNFCKACKAMGLNTEFAEISDINIDALQIAFENLGYTSDRHKCFFKFIWTGPLVWNRCLEKHMIPRGAGQWVQLFQSFELDNKL